MVPFGCRARRIWPVVRHRHVSAGATETSELLAGVRLVIFDADGTLRRTLVPGLPCPHAQDQWELLPGVRECLTAIDWRARNLRVGVASNQDHVGYGLIDDTLARSLLRAAIDAATDNAAPDPVIRLCPHRLEEPCTCRKPAPGMLLDIMREVGASPAATLFVGDTPTDAEAARRAGVRFAWANEFFGKWATLSARVRKP
jgi:D-glycero-D-manno-heptose 1,7-bisphosphate phosphatase